MQRYADWFRDAEGRGFPGAIVTVYKAGTSTLALLYTANGDIDNPAPIANPTTTDSNGFFAFAVSNGVYDIQIQAGGMPTTYLPNIAIFTEGGIIQVDASEVTVAPSGGITSTNAQDALEELDSEITALTTDLDGKVDKNAPITPGTHTQITYDANGLVTGGTTPAKPVYTASEIVNVPAGGIVATNVQNALNELDTEATAISGRVTTLESTEEPVGQCRLVYTNSTTVTLQRYMGRFLTINGVRRAIPAAGVTLASTGLAATTLYYIYAYWTGTMVALEASTLTHGVDSITGVEIKAGDPTRTLVGMVYCQTAATFIDDLSHKLVLSWFNIRQARMLGAFMNGVATTSTTYAELSASGRCYFLARGDMSIQAGITGIMTNSVAGGRNNVQLRVDTVSITEVEDCVMEGNVYAQSSSASVPATPTEGYHYVTIYVKVSAGTGAIYSKLNTSVWV